MKKTQASLSINLAKKKGNATVEAVLHWAITIGRFLVILTETIALAAFLYRFVLDRQVIDLSDKIEGKQRLVQSLSREETRYRSLQDRLLFIKEQDEISQKVPDLFTKIIDLARGKVTFSTFTITEGQIRMDVTTPSISQVNSYISSLRSLKEIEDISIDRIENKTSTAVITVTISANLIEEFRPVKEVNAALDQPNL